MTTTSSAEMPLSRIQDDDYEKSEETSYKGSDPSNKTGPKSRVKVPKGREDYVDTHHKHWRFVAVYKNEQEFSLHLNKNWLTKHNETSNSIFYRCRYSIKCSKGKHNCNFRGVFLRSNSKLYSLEQHNHELFDWDMPNKAPKDNEDYIDQYGKHWPFLATIKDETNLAKCLKENWLMIGGNQLKNLSRYTCIRKKHCEFRALYLQYNHSFYTYGRHNHEIYERDRKSLMRVPNGREDYVGDRQRHWRFLAVSTEVQNFEQLLHQNWLLKPRELPNSFLYTCRYGYKKPNCRRRVCKFKAILLKKNSTLYTRGRHNHSIFERVGWKLLAKNLRNQPRLESICRQQMLERKKTVEASEKNSAHFLFICRENGCKFKAHFFPSLQSIYAKGKHSHPMEENVDEKNALRNDVENLVNEDEAEAEVDEREFVEQQEREEGQNMDNQIEMPAPELDVQIVDEINHEEHKGRLPPMKLEGDAEIGANRSCWPTLTIDSELPIWKQPFSRSEKIAMLHRVKKEEPREEEPIQEEQPKAPETVQKMLLRERKNPVNYGEGRKRKN